MFLGALVKFLQEYRKTDGDHIPDHVAKLAALNHPMGIFLLRVGAFNFDLFKMVDRHIGKIDEFSEYKDFIFNVLAPLRELRAKTTVNDVEDFHAMFNFFKTETITMLVSKVERLLFGDNFNETLNIGGDVMITLFCMLCDTAM